MREARPALRLRCMGTRGSIPSPGPDTLRYGGNTSCVEVVAGGHRLIFDAGTGIRALGEELAAGDGPGPTTPTTLFLTHFHWDHVQALPFFAPAYDETAEVHVVGPVQTDAAGVELSVRTLVGGLMGSSYFPIDLSALVGLRSFGHLNEGTWEGTGERGGRRGGVTVRAMRVKHASFTVGYRVDVGEHSVAYVPDNELLSDAFPVSPDWRARFVGFLKGVDILIHDAMYTNEEYPSHTGYGHSSWSHAMDLADEVGAGELLFFHHAPTRTDDELDELVKRARAELLAAGRTFGVRAAREGEVLGVGEDGNRGDAASRVAPDSGPRPLRVHTAPGEAADLQEMLDDDRVEFVEIGHIDELRMTTLPSVLFLSRGLLGEGGALESLAALPAKVVVIAADDGARSAAGEAGRLFLAAPELAPGGRPLLRALRSAGKHAEALARLEAQG